MTVDGRPTVLSLFGVEPKRVGGTEVLVKETSRQLARHGWHHVAVFSGSPSPAAAEYLSLPNLTIEKLDRPWETSPATVNAVRALLKKYKPQIFHFSYTGLVGPYPWLCRLHGVKKVFFTDQGSQPEGHVSHLAPVWKRAAARLINAPLNRVFSISESNRNILVTTGTFPAQSVQRIYNAVHLPPYGQEPRASDFRKRWGIPMDRKVVVQVSWIIPEKGIEDLLQAAAMVVAENPLAHFVFVGDGKYRQEFTAQAHQMGIGSHVTWTGLIQNPLEEGAYAAADVVCQVSRWNEAFGWSITEAMAFSKPLVATAVGGIPEIVEDGVTGFVVPRRDPAAIANRLRKLFADPDLRCRMGRAGRAAAEAKFDLCKNVAELIRAYGIG